MKRFWSFLVKSLRVRFFLILFITGLFSCMIMQSAILTNYKDRAIEVKKNEVQTQLRILANHLITYNYMQDPSSAIVQAELTLLANLYDGRVLIIGDDLQVITDTYGKREGKTIISEEVVNCLRKGSDGVATVYDNKNGYLEITTPIIETAGIGDGDYLSSEAQTKEVVKGVMLTSVSTANIEKTMEILNNKALVIEVIVIMLILVFSLVASKALLKPFDRITSKLNEMKAGFTDELLSVPDYIETEHIVDAFNQLQGRMKVLDDSRQEFVSNVSHELKTPITSMKVLADTLLSQEDAPGEVYRDFLSDISAEIDREDKIINDLLSLVKMDKKATQPNIASVNVNQMTEIVLKRLRPIANKRNIELILESHREIVAEIDEVKISLVIMNLVENAVKYNKDGGWVRVTLDADHQYFTIRVADSGIGMPKEDLDKIYERFYRVDQSRSREVGGTGLGLAVAKSAVLLHRGEISADSTEGSGTTFVVKIPLNYISTDTAGRAGAR